MTVKKKTRSRAKSKQAREPAIQYHIGFVGAMNCELWDYRDNITIDAEKQLNEKPLIIDCLILKLGKDVRLDVDIGRHFLGSNLIEYKSWRKSLSLETMLQIGAYGMQYGRLQISKEPGLWEDMTLSIFTHKYSKSFFDGLADHGFKYEDKGNGIYEITAPKKWVGKTILQLEIRRNYNVSVLALKNGSFLQPLPPVDHVFTESEHVMVLSRDEDLRRIIDT